jgi:chorismate dehydratase
MKRVGISSYLNTQPLAYAFRKGIVKPNFEIVYAKPHECAKMLLNKELDAALIPSIEYARAKDEYHILDSFCIGADRHVQSVLLFFKEDIETINTVALDDSSRTSVILSKIILEEKYELEPDYITMEPNLDKMLENADAALLIGDNALEQSQKHANYLDLADEWFDMTGHPFVFAFIAGYEKSLSNEDMFHIDKAVKYGLDHLKNIAEDWQSDHPEYSAEFYQEYLQQNISFNFDDQKKEALNIFFDYAFLRNDLDFFPEFKYYLKQGDEKLES